MEPPSAPPAAEALAAHPTLRAQAGRALAGQLRRIAERSASFVPRPDALGALDALLGAVPGGLVALEAAPGSGATALLCHLAATRPYAFWLPQDDQGGGLEALCAQLAALHGLPIPLVPPAAGRDASALERLLAEVGAARPPGDPAVVLLGRPRPPHGAPRPDPFPAAIPAGVVVVQAYEPGEPLPAGAVAAARLALPSEGPQAVAQIAALAAALGAPAELAAALAARSHGSFLYVRLAAGLLAAGARRGRALPAGLAALHRAWWAALGAHERRLAAVLTAAGEPLDLALAARAARLPPEDAQQAADRWRAFLERAGPLARIYHPATAAFVARVAGSRLSQAHAALADLAAELAAGRLDQGGWDQGGYFSRQLARHLALGTPRPRLAAVLATRPWHTAQERRTSSHRAGASDAAWALRSAVASGDPLALVRGAALAGTMSVLARSLPPDAPAEALNAALDRGVPRDAALRSIRRMVDELPDGRDKAQTLRRLGEVCFAIRLRASAMRMLSEALDLEAPGLPRSWRDEREEALVALARAATALGAPDMALGITTRIVHAERRGMIETEVVRWLLARGQRTRAEEVAYAIGHAGNHEWAMAEVAVGHARAGDYDRAGVVLSTLRTDTAVAWVSTEIACDAARRRNPRAADRVAMLPTQSLRDRALAQVALALVEGRLPAAALDAARMIMHDEVRARALVDLALAHLPLSPEALDEASQAAGAISGDEQAPVIAALAAAQAAVGRPEDALRTATVLPEGEGRDRAQSRIAVALARVGEFEEAEVVAQGIADDDERDWALDELARLLGASGAWRESFMVAGQIVAEEQRAQTEADLAIGWARAGEPVAAHARARQIALAGERLRAETTITVPLVTAGARAHVFEAVAAFQELEARSRYQAAAAAALAGHGAVDEAESIADHIARPLDRARARVTVARAAAATGQAAQAGRLLGQALQESAWLGRREVFLCIGWAADALGAVGGPELLLAAAGALDELDAWWG